MLNMPDLSGRQINQFRLIRKLGGGGYGVVYLAKHVEYGTPVTIKILFTPLSAENIPDFIMEAKLSVLDHPNIVRLRDFGIDNGYPYFIMNYLQHGNLRKRHPKGTRLRWETIVSYVRQVAKALQYVHDKEIVHCDVKPENLLIGDDGGIQLCDFGVAITSYTVNQRIQIPRGSCHYIAPEQIDGRAQRASDQYSLGVIMYEWLTGEPLFEGTQDEVILKHLHAAPVRLRRKDATISPQIEHLVMKMLSKRPDDRFKNMREFLMELERVNNAISVVKPMLFKEHKEAVQSLSWSPDGRYIASAGHDKIVHVWDAATGRILYTYYRHIGEVWSVMWSPTGKYIVSAGADEIVHAWEATTGKALTSFAEHQKTIRMVCWSPTGLSIASASDDAFVQVWDLQMARLITSYGEHRERVLCLAWSPTGKYIASGGNDCTVRVWEAATGSYCSFYPGHHDRITSIAWSPDGTHIASASDDGTVQIWVAETGSPQSIYHDHSQTVSSVAWSPNGNYLTSGSWDKTVRVWDVAKSVCISTYEGHTQWVNAVVWSPNGRYIASASWDKSVHIFPFDSASSIRPDAPTVPDIR